MSTLELGNNVDGLDTLYGFLNSVKEKMESGHYPTKIVGPFGVHGVMYSYGEDDEIFATVGFNLPDGIYAEIEDGTYGQQQGFRIVLADNNAEAITDHGYSIALDNVNTIEVRDADGNHVDYVEPDDERFEHFLRVIVEASR